MSQRNTKVLAWCFTLNNYGETEYSEIISKIRACCVYFIVGREVGEAGTPHLQGYFILKERSRISTLKTTISSRAHFEAARGKGGANRAYCSKDGDFIEEGDIPVRFRGGGPDDPRKRKSRDELAGEYRLQLEHGRLGIDKFADENPGVFAWSGHTLYRNFISLGGAKERPDIHVEWIWGPPGVGKSRKAHEQYPNAYIKDPRTKWWNGYLLEKEVIIDDFGPNGIDINHLLRWFDRYKCYVEIKGDMCPLCADKFIVTSNFHPEKVFTDNMGVVHVQYPALERRIVITEML